jgi:selenide,water dikinase
MLATLPEEDLPALLSSIHSGEDASVYLITDDLAVVQTVDFFPPIVDDPYTFGQIAAANALSDIYAMNATPLTAMNIAAWPCESGTGILETVLLGGYDKVHEAGAVVAGGHTIEDEEPKFGLAVMGTVRPGDMTTIRGARTGDLLVLTKPLGTGIMTTALKAGLISEAELREVVLSMCELNAEAARVIASRAVGAMTDVTGFGLAGHLYEMVRASGTGATIWAGEVPLFDNALDMVASGMAPRSSAGDCFGDSRVEVEEGGVDDLLVQCMFDPQTSGGLLASIPAGEAEDLVSELRGGPALRASIVGEITEVVSPKVRIEQSRER